MNREYDNETEGNGGVCMLIYSETNYGKTHGLGTAPSPIYVIPTEPKDPRNVLAWCKADGIPVKFFERDIFDDYMELLVGWENQAKEGKFEAKTVAIDSLSFLQSTFKSKFEDDHSERVSLKKNLVTLYDRFSMGEDTMMGWGGLASLLKRITGALNRLSKYGICTIATATELASPKYKAAGGAYFQSGPSFQGREYPSQMMGYYDVIGRLIEPWKIVDGAIKRPRISFVSQEGDYVARATGKLAPVGENMPYNISKILKVIRGEEKSE